MVIGADGWSGAIRAAGALDKYLARLQKRMELLGKLGLNLFDRTDKKLDRLFRRLDALGRKRVRIDIALSDCLCAPIANIRKHLESITSKSWEVSLQASFESNKQTAERLKSTVETTVKTSVEAKLDLAVAMKSTCECICGDGGKDGAKDKEAGSDKGKEASGEAKEPGWLKQIKGLGKDFGKAFKDRAMENMASKADPLIEKLSNKKGLGFLKLLLPEKQNEANSNKVAQKVECVCTCKCEGDSSVGGGRKGKKTGRSSGKRAAGRTAAQKNAAGNTAADRTAPDSTAADKTAADQKAAGKTAAKKKAAGKTAADRMAPDTTAADKTSANQKAAGTTQNEETAGEANANKAKGPWERFKNFGRSIAERAKGLSGNPDEAGASGDSAKSANTTEADSAAKKPKTFGGRMLAAGKNLARGAGKLLGPAGVVLGAMDIARAEPGEERNKAIGRTVGGVVGSALGSIVFPGVGTIALGMAGSAAGEWVSEKAAGVIDKIKSFWPFGKKKEKNDPQEAAASAAKAPAKDGHAASYSGSAALQMNSGIGGMSVAGRNGLAQTMALSAGASAAVMSYGSGRVPGPGIQAGVTNSSAGAGIVPLSGSNPIGGVQGGESWLNSFFERLTSLFRNLENAIASKPSGPPGTLAPRPTASFAGGLPNAAAIGTPGGTAVMPPQPAPINISVAPGAVQLTVKEQELDYNAIAAQVSARISASIQQSLENRV